MVATKKIYGFLLAVGLVMISAPVFSQQIAYATAGSRRTGFIGEGMVESQRDKDLRRSEANRRLFSADQRVLVHKGGDFRWLDMANFDVLGNQLEEIGSAGEVFFFTPDIVDGFVYYDREQKKHSFLSLFCEELDSERFMEVLEEGEVSLFMHPIMRTGEYGANLAYAASSNVDAVSQSFEYYYRIGELGDLVKFSPSRNTMKEIFGQRSPETIEYMRKNVMNLGRIEGVQKLFCYYNSLQAEDEE